jgi:plastocyanin
MRRALIVAALAASSVAAAQAPTSTVTLTEWKIELSRDTVPEGSVTFRLNNQGTIAHAFWVRGPGMDKGSRDVAARASATLTLTLKAGTYDVFCPLSENSHKMAGMARKLVVKAAAAPAPENTPKR